MENDCSQSVVLNLILVQFMAHAGLALATSIATTIATFLMFRGLKKKIGSLGTMGFIATFVKTAIASGVMGVFAYLIYHGLHRALGASSLFNMISLLVAVGVGVILYLVVSYLLGVEEIKNIAAKVTGRLRK